MKILSIESSCDETSAAVLKKVGDKITLLSNIIASSAELQEKFGGIIPEQAAREQLKSIIPVIKEALSASNSTPKDIDAIAVTQGPGLIGSLLVGVETAKVLSLIWNKPLIPVNHLIGHFYANWISPTQKVDAVLSRAAGRMSAANDKAEHDNTHQLSLPSFPCIGLLVSGGHSDLVLFKNHGEFEYLGGTRDDAAGECFDKCARLLGLPYPGGPQISKLGSVGDSKSFDLPRPMIYTNDFDFSYSGLKTAVSNLISSQGANILPREEDQLSNLCASIEQAIIDPLILKTIKAAKKYGVNCIILGGGVSANKKLCSELQLAINNEQLSITLHTPPPILCTDNAAMIGSAAFFIKDADPLSIQANPNLSLAY